MGEKFLTRRTSSVRVGGCASFPTDVPNGMSHGPVLGFTPFLMFVGDIAKSTRDICYFFVDVKEEVGDLEEDIITVKAWSRK